MFQRNPKHQELDNSNGCLTKVCPQELEAYVISPNLGFPVTNFQIQDFRVYNYRRGRKEKKERKKKEKNYYNVVSQMQTMQFWARVPTQMPPLIK